MKSIYFIGLFFVVVGLYFLAQGQTEKFFLALVLALVFSLAGVEKNRHITIPKERTVDIPVRNSKQDF